MIVEIFIVESLFKKHPETANKPTPQTTKNNKKSDVLEQQKRA